MELADASDEELKVADATRAAAERERDEALERMRSAEAAEAEADARVGAARARDPKEKRGDRERGVPGAAGHSERDVDYVGNSPRSPSNAAMDARSSGASLGLG